VNSGAICRAGHQSIKDIEFADQVSFADATYRRVAAHLAKVSGPERYEADTCATTRRCRRSFATGMTAANYQNVVHALALAESVFQRNDRCGDHCFT